MVAADSPARPPAIRNASTQTRSTLMPALRAALGLAPTVRNWKPTVLRESSQAVAAAAATAIRNPTPTCGGGPPTCGSIALDAMPGATALVCFGACIRLWLVSRNDSRLYMT